MIIFKILCIIYFGFGAIALHHTVPDEFKDLTVGDKILGYFAMMFLYPVGIVRGLKKFFKEK